MTLHAQALIQGRTYRDYAQETISQIVDELKEHDITCVQPTAPIIPEFLINIPTALVHWQRQYANSINSGTVDNLTMLRITQTYPLLQAKVDAGRLKCQGKEHVTLESDDDDQ